MRNYWALLPAIAVFVALALVYAVPTLINPQFTANVLALFRRESEASNPAAVLTTTERRSRRLYAVAVLAAALALVGFNVSLNREANGCYLAAQAWGADDADDGKRIDHDPCVHKIMGAYFSSPSGSVIADDPQPVLAYQVVTDEEPGYIRWVQNRPHRDKADLIVGAPFLCDDVKFTESDDQITLVLDSTDPCPTRPQISLVSIDLAEPLGDRAVVTIDDQPVRRIDPDLPSWGSVLTKLGTGG